LQNFARLWQFGQRQEEQPHVLELHDGQAFKLVLSVHQVKSGLLSKFQLKFLFRLILALPVH
jgi:hypothetical protein